MRLSGSGEHALLDLVRQRRLPADAPDGSAKDEHSAALEVDLDYLLDGQPDHTAPNAAPADDQEIRAIGA
jgi:hypothetical protein